MTKDNSNIIPFPAPEDLSGLKIMLEYTRDEASRIGLPLVANLCGAAAMSLDFHAETNGGATIDRESPGGNASNVVFELLEARRGDDSGPGFCEPGFGPIVVTKDYTH